MNFAPTESETTMTAPTPLPAHSRKVMERRYEAGIFGPKNDRGGRREIAMGRFTTHEDAKTWADRNFPDAEIVNITFYSAQRGWIATHVSQRKDGTWTE